ncbi:MAG: HlyD family efflux transporter periplasmic adaptor subunit [Sedimentisphaerales bacterium]|nr:HlyD family efflux transporter periplasmic adaptor subunit [Sedimentisphaerales bacterium]
MDIPRKSRKVRRIVIRIIIALITLGAIGAITVGLSRLEPASPSVERQTLLIDSVKRGDIILEVRGVGTLVSEDMLVVPSRVSGRALRILIQAGAPVEPNTVIFELGNPQLELNWKDAQTQLNSAQAQFNASKAQLLNQEYTYKAGIAATEALVSNASLTFEVDKKQYEDGLISDLQLKLSKSNVERLENQLDVEKKQFDVWLNQTKPAQLVLDEASLERARSQYNLAEEDYKSLKVRAGAAGVLAPIQVPIELGQQISAGQIVARITNPERLMARLQIPQGQARDVRIGLPAEIDTYNGLVSGRVTRIEPTVMEGNVTVDVSLDGELPKGSRPDLSVVGTIEIEQLIDIFYVGRPVLASADSKVELFKLVEDGRYAVRVPVQFGKTSVSTIEVLNGLVVGDQIILSDVSQWDTVDKIRLK